MEEDENGVEVFIEESTLEIVDNGEDTDWRFELKFLCNEEVISKLTNSKGKLIRKRIEQKRNVNIKVESCSVTIKGNAETDITLAEKEIRKTGSKSQKPQLTHFLSIPFNNEEIKNNHIKFKDEILETDCAIHKLDASFFYKPEKLHLTLVMLTLENEEKVEDANKCLIECKEKIIDPILNEETLSVTLSGVNIMNNKPSSTRILFGVVENEKLQQIANEIAQFFSERGFIKLDRPQVKLHVTLINTSKAKRKRAFNATEIIEKYKDFHFGTHEIKQIHISKLLGKSDDGYYESAGRLEF
ncbi:CLUMA_CG016300, isoform A [Clunio marinus]|uniref:CLUMA_CG016300, isoform A n=1 Tax=Clunio marinus TaxID=568069 RepID=A0A1J1IWU9_9DIPT|nr:CLUMA_CG016300, isoform A [Clunio marinus]